MMQTALIAALSQQVPIDAFPGRCIRLRGKLECTACVDACPVSLPFSTRETILGSSASEHCLRCGACTTACPTGALQLAGETYARWLREISQRFDEARQAGDVPALLAVSCFAVRAGGHSLRIGCLQAWDPSLVFYAWCTGFRLINVVTGPCERCDLSKNPVLRPSHWVPQAAALSHSLELGREVEISYHEREDDIELNGHVEEAFDRRDFLSHLKRKGRALLGTMLSNSTGEQPLRHELGVGGLPPRRFVLMRSLSNLLMHREEDCRPALSATIAASALVNLSFPHLKRGECRACGDCARFCPTGALTAIRRGSSWKLRIDKTRCVSCGLCEALCDVGALQIKLEGLKAVFDTSAVLVSRPLLRCPECGERFPLPREVKTGGRIERSSLCPRCRRREERFDGFY